MSVQAMPATRSVEQVTEQLVAELGAGLGVLVSALGVRCGIWRAMAGAGPLTAAEVAARTGLVEPYAGEWLRAQAAAGYLEYAPTADAYSLPEPVAAAVLDGPGGAIVDACAALFTSIGAGWAGFEAAFRAGEGYGWDRRGPDYWAGTDGLTRASLPPDLLAAAVADLPGVAAALRAGGAVADVGCGYGAPTMMLAAAYPQAAVTGFDRHDPSVAAARAAAARAEGPAGRVRFEVAGAADFPGTGYALITFVDSLHDLGDPVGALAHARAALAPDGAVLLVEPLGADAVQDNLTPVGRLFYAVSTLVCTPTAMSQPAPAGTAPLGTLAGGARLREVARAAGFTRVRRLAVPAPLNLLLEVRG